MIALYRWFSFVYYVTYYRPPLLRKQHVTVVSSAIASAQTQTSSRFVPNAAVNCVFINFIT